MAAIDKQQVLEQDFKDGAVIQDHDLLGDKAQADHCELAHLGHLGQLSEEEKIIEKKLVRRIDLLILPLVITVYLTSYIDRNNFAAAKLQGLTKDLHLNDTEYHTCIGILFPGYVIGGIFTNTFLNWTGRPSYYLGAFTLSWGLISALSFLSKNFAGILICRLILGFVEAPFFPGVLYYLSRWYTKSELAFRTALFYTGSLLAGALGNLIAAGILHGLAGKRGLGAWQWLYIVEGSITIFLGFLVILVLPDFPHTCKAMSPEMRHVAQKRLAIDAAEADVDEGSNMSHFKGFVMAMKDPRVHAMLVFFFFKGCSDGYQFVFPQLTQTLGYNNTISLLLAAPPYFFILFSSIFNSWISDHIKKRLFFILYSLPLSMIGFILFMTTNSFGPRYLSLFLMVFSFNINGIFFAWVSSSIPRPPAKRAAAYSYINGVGNLGNTFVTYLYNKPPHYTLAMCFNIGFQCVALLAAGYLRWDLTRTNKRMERMENEDVPLSAKDLAKLQKTADLEDVDLATARRLQKDYRFII